MTNGVSVGRRTDERAEPVRTDMHCHECNLNFVARLDLSIDGNHTIVCPNPNCGHLHYRYVDKGVVTGERWQSSSNANTIADVDRTSGQQPIMASTRSAFLRDSWLNRSDG